LQIVNESLSERLIAFLGEQGADFHVLHHEAVRTSAEAAHVRGTSLEQGAKALVFKAGDRVLLLVLPANLRVDTHGFRRALGVRSLSMIGADDLLEQFGLEVGAVPPFGHLLGLTTYVDRRLIDQPRIAFNAGSRTVSVLLATADFVRLEQPIVGQFAEEAGLAS
jgi:prolyl-tRNA editing enzyme YbaK/EbsC (Cys-tRNA(Pro) deacylase)